MRINEKIKKCVAFLQLKKADGSYEYTGTCFFVASPESQNHHYVITAKHVLDGVKKKGLDEIHIKLNLNTGKTNIISTKINEWILHEDENVDIAIYKFNFDDSYDHLYYPESSFMTDALAKENEIDCGDEVFITGLFKHHAGNVKNSPIVRIGNIALMPSEKIHVRHHSIDAYLIESRSIGGLSGSPVFVNLGDVRKLNNQVKHASGEHIPLLLGLVYGHFDSIKNEVDEIKDITHDEEKLNVGIAIVTPVAKLSEMLNSRKAIAKK